MLAPDARDAAATAAVLGFFGSAWFGWAQDSPPQAWRSALVAGSILSLLVCAAGTLLTWRRWSEPTALDAQTSRVFGIVVGIEFRSPIVCNDWRGDARQSGADAGGPGTKLRG